MVGVGVAEGGGGGGDGYYGEYYPPETYYVPPEMCPHPQQHPQHAHMCTVHTEYGKPSKFYLRLPSVRFPWICLEGIRGASGRYFVCSPGLKI